MPPHARVAGPHIYAPGISPTTEAWAMPGAKAVAPESFMDLPFVKQLDHSGFIRGLYPKG